MENENLNFINGFCRKNPDIGNNNAISMYCTKTQITNDLFLYDENRIQYALFHGPSFQTLPSNMFTSDINETINKIYVVKEPQPEPSLNQSLN